MAGLLGMFTALSLEMLGVPRPVVIRDYALTGIFRPNRVAAYLRSGGLADTDLDLIRANLLGAP